MSLSVNLLFNLKNGPKELNGFLKWVLILGFD